MSQSAKAHTPLAQARDGLECSIDDEVCRGGSEREGAVDEASDGNGPLRGDVVRLSAYEREVGILRN